ncbi:GreA/GreB family elongation factor [uncultured Sunxiuqinia sp.]|uniref:GreA/GreB family elongation factor n=1 Tax=uncultured Sunxiuqinia sp. TaxID=1573825 RepID=UPI00260AB9CF|nr:GreA/GreB family elongation factor [uncultured Sunxiuqinia sp.]
MDKQITITELDFARLSKLTLSEKKLQAIEVRNLPFLTEEINRAAKVESKAIASDYVTMNSKVEVLDPDTKRVMTFQLVYPEEANLKNGKISVLSPMGSALLGYKAGDTISFNVPKGIKKMEIKSILYQPESQGEYTV